MALATVARLEAGGVTVTLRADRPAALADLARRLRRAPRPRGRPALVYDLLAAPARRRVVRNGRTLHAARRLADVVDVLELDLLWQVAAMTAALPLHAAGVVLPRAGRDAAVLLVGASGAGKSTLTLELLGRGARVLGDDHAFVWPDGAATGLPRAVRVAPPGGVAEEDRPLPAAAVAARAPVGLVVLLGRPRTPGAAPVPLAGAAAVAALLPHVRRVARPEDVAALARLAAAVPVVALAREGPAAAADAVVAALAGAAAPAAPP